jgi:membrane protein YqaA with SNARE-associated domain
MSVAVGVLRLPLPVFLLVGTAGRFVRFYLLALLPGVF